jgi:hypothetical protein
MIRTSLFASALLMLSALTAVEAKRPCCKPEELHFLAQLTCFESTASQLTVDGFAQFKAFLLNDKFEFAGFIEGVIVLNDCRSIDESKSASQTLGFVPDFVDIYAKFILVDNSHGSKNNNGTLLHFNTITASAVIPFEDTKSLQIGGNSFLDFAILGGTGNFCSAQGEIKVRIAEGLKDLARIDIRLFNKCSCFREEDIDQE